MSEMPRQTHSNILADKSRTAHGQNEIHEMSQMRTEKLAEESADERRITDYDEDEEEEPVREKKPKKEKRAKSGKNGELKPFLFPAAFLQGFLKVEEN